MFNLRKPIIIVPIYPLKKNLYKIPDTASFRYLLYFLLKKENIFIIPNTTKKVIPKT